MLEHQLAPSALLVLLLQTADHLAANLVLMVLTLLWVLHCVHPAHQGSSRAKQAAYLVQQDMSHLGRTRPHASLAVQEPTATMAVQFVQNVTKDSFQTKEQARAVRVHQEVLRCEECLSALLALLAATR